MQIWSRLAVGGLLIAVCASLTGCNLLVLNPPGKIALAQGRLILISTSLMLLVIVPVIVMVFLFAWRYRRSNTRAAYAPDWDHSVQLELFIWAGPLLIIITLGALTWIGTPTLDPFRPLASAPTQKPPLTVDVVALDWKWLFIYPEQGIAVVNELAAPADRPLHFRVTAESVMNSFYIPALAGQIYAMPGMETQLHAIMEQTGAYEGFSANYSGAGFSGMHFPFRSLSDDDFSDWVQQARRSPEKLDRPQYLQLARPTEREPVRRFASVAPDLYSAIVNRCVDPRMPCMDAMLSAGAQHMNH